MCIRDRLQGDGLSGIAALAALLLSMTMVDLFDTLGFLIGTGARAGLLEEDGSLPGTGRVLIADASATVLGALCGTCLLYTSRYQPGRQAPPADRPGPPASPGR